MVVVGLIKGIVLTVIFDIVAIYSADTLVGFSTVKAGLNAVVMSSAKAVAMYIWLSVQ
jgi:hypothetical protein